MSGSEVELGEFFTGELLTDCDHLLAELWLSLGPTCASSTPETDHVHLLVHYPPSLAVSMLVNLAQRRLVTPTAPAVS